VLDIEHDKQATRGLQERADVEEFVRTILVSGADLVEDGGDVAADDSLLWAPGALEPSAP
jgi:hypothetical protein